MSASDEKHSGRSKKILIWFWPGLAMLGLFAFAAFLPNSNVTAVGREEGTTLAWAGVLVRLMLAFGVVVALAYGGIWSLRRLMNRSAGNPATGVVSLVATSYIAPKKQISVVRVFDRLLVIGVAEGSMTLLAEIAPDEAEEKLRGLEGRQVLGGGFLGLLRRQAETMTRPGL